VSRDQSNTINLVAATFSGSERDKFGRDACGALRYGLDRQRVAGGGLSPESRDEQRFSSEVDEREGMPGSLTDISLQPKL
jgi:hypothetical protein